MNAPFPAPTPETAAALPALDIRHVSKAFVVGRAVVEVLSDISLAVEAERSAWMGVRWRDPDRSAPSCSRSTACCPG